jgi:hypothetical protein
VKVAKAPVAKGAKNEWFMTLEKCDIFYMCEIDIQT